MRYLLKLFVTGSVQENRRVIGSLKLIEEQLGEECESSVINVLEQPALAEEEKIIATPTLIRYWPLPITKVIGDLADIKKAVAQIKL